jgi:TetR/AcrR family macrolide resistance operon transcriptional repressor
MARPLTATDDDIVKAAYAVVQRVGYEGFTISEVARQLGLTRAAITQRFGSADQLKTIVCRLTAEQLEGLINQLSAVPGPEGLLEFATFLGGMIGSRENLSSFLQGYSRTIHDQVRLQLEERRGRAMRAAIQRVMPPCNVVPEIAADMFMTFMSGSMLAWKSGRSEDAISFLREQTLQWMELAGIEYDAALASPGESRCP